MLHYGYLGVGLGGVGWGNDVHVNLPTHVMLRYCYVLLHLHTHVMLRYGDLLLHLLTHVMLRYGDLLLHLLTHVMLRYGGLLLHLHTHTSCYVMVVLGWGWVGWGHDVHVNLHTHTHVMLRYCYVLLHLHTHVMLRYGDLLLHFLTHVMLRYGDLLLHLLTHVMLRYGDLLLHLHTHVMRTIVFADGNRAWESHAKSLKIKHAKVSHQNKEWTKQMRRTSFFSCPLRQGRKSLTDGGKAFPRRLYDGDNTKEHPELEKFLLAKIFGTIDTSPVSRRTLQGRQSNEALLRRRKKVLHPKKTRTYVKKRRSFGDFQNPIFHVNMRKNDVSL